FAVRDNGNYCSQQQRTSTESRGSGAPSWQLVAYWHLRHIILARLKLLQLDHQIALCRTDKTPVGGDPEDVVDWIHLELHACDLQSSDGDRWPTLDGKFQRNQLQRRRMIGLDLERLVGLQVQLGTD